MNIKAWSFCMLTAFVSYSSNTEENPYIIKKEKGHIILAYKAFEDFLNSDRSWISYKSILLDPFPSVMMVHNRQIEWGGIDTNTFVQEIKNFRKDDYSNMFGQYKTEEIVLLYDSLISLAHRILPPLKAKEVDLCFFLPYGGCFVIPEPTKNTIFISLRINPAEARKIIAHEYGHIMHIDRKPDETLTLRREIISEGMAVYLTGKIINDLPLNESIPFMPAENYEWCMQHESMIKDSIRLELADTTMRLFKRFISDGTFADPPMGFVQKTGYFTGYRIIEKCVNQGMTLEEICALNSEEVIKISGYFQQ